MLSIMEVQQFVLIEVDIHSGFVFTVLSAPAITTIYLWLMHILHTSPSTERLMYHIGIYNTQRPLTMDIFYGNCSHKIKRHLLLGRKVMTNLDSILKNRDIVNKGPSSQGYGFSSSHVCM